MHPPLAGRQSLSLRRPPAPEENRSRIAASLPPATLPMNATHPLDLVKLPRLMALTAGKPAILVGLIDGPVDTGHADLANQNIRRLPGKILSQCTRADSFACLHGTFAAGILSARRDSLAPAICPDCPLLVYPIFTEAAPPSRQMPSATPEDLAAAITECTEAGARVINLSVAVMQSSAKGKRELEDALDHAARRGVITVAAAGNQATVGSSILTGHPGVISVVGCDLQGRPMGYSNLGSSIGRRGLGAPGENITSLRAGSSKPLVMSGTSVAAPFVTGAIALLWSEFPAATATEVRLAVTQGGTWPRRTIVPPLLDAWAAYQVLRAGSIESTPLPSRAR